jgi:hypothetical protein
VRKRERETKRDTGIESEKERNMESKRERE